VHALAYDPDWLSGAAFDVFDSGAGAVKSSDCFDTEGLQFKPVFNRLADGKTYRLQPYFLAGIAKKNRSAFGARMELPGESDWCEDWCEECDGAVIQHVKTGLMECYNCGLELKGGAFAQPKHEGLSRMPDFDPANDYVELMWALLRNPLKPRGYDGLRVFYPIHQRWLKGAPLLRSWSYFVSNFCSNSLHAFGYEGQRILGNMAWGLAAPSWRDDLLREAGFKNEIGRGLAKIPMNTFYRTREFGSDNLIIRPVSELSEFKPNKYATSVVLGAYLLGNAKANAGHDLPSIRNSELRTWHKKMHADKEIAWGPEHMLATVSFMQRYAWFLMEKEIHFDDS